VSKAQKAYGDHRLGEVSERRPARITSGVL